MANTFAFKSARSFLCSFQLDEIAHEEDVQNAKQRISLVFHMIRVKSDLDLYPILDDMYHRIHIYPAYSLMRLFIQWILVRTLIKFFNLPYEHIQLWIHNQYHLSDWIIRDVLRYTKQSYFPTLCPLKRYIIQSIQKDRKDIMEHFYPMVSQTFAAHITKHRLGMFKEELIQKTCHPSRLQWWMEEDEKKELQFLLL